MTNSAIIEVVIGMVFVYILMSLLVTQINTIIGHILNTRAKGLKIGMVHLLSDPVIRAKIMTHPLIGLVSNDLLPSDHVTSQAATEMVDEDTNVDVSWVETHTFVDVLVDVLASGTGDKLYKALYDAVDAMPPSIEKSEIRELIRRMQLSGNGLPQLREAIRNLEDKTQQQSLLSALHLVEDALDKLSVESSDLIPLFLGVRQIQDPNFQRALEAVLKTANGLGDAQVKLGQWFDNNMAHVSDAFKRYMQWMSLLVGFMLALLLNIDTLNLAQTLWEDPALRESLAATANTTVPQLADQIDAARSDNAATAEPTPESTTGTDAAPADGDTSDNISASMSDARTLVNSLFELRLPIGWELTPVTAVEITASRESALLPNPLTNTRNLWNYFPGNNPDNWFGLLIKKLIGLGVTMIAVAQGAPFWFDLLNRFSGGKSSSTASASS